MIVKIFASLFIILMVTGFLTADKLIFKKIILPLYLASGAGFLISLIWSMP